MMEFFIELGKRLQENPELFGVLFLLTFLAYLSVNWYRVSRYNEIRREATYDLINKIRSEDAQEKQKRNRLDELDLHNEQNTKFYKMMQVAQLLGEQTGLPYTVHDILELERKVEERLKPQHPHQQLLDATDGIDPNYQENLAAAFDVDINYEKLKTAYGIGRLSLGDDGELIEMIFNDEKEKNDNENRNS